MRIRKYAKISPLTYAVSSLKPATHLCHLNQSPWDAAATTIPTLHQHQQKPDDDEDEDEDEYPSSSSINLPSSSPPPPHPPPPHPRLPFEFDEYDTFPQNAIFSDSKASSQSPGLRKCDHRVSQLKHRSSFAKKHPQPTETTAAHRRHQRKKVLVSPPIEMYLLNKQIGSGRADPSRNVVDGLGSDIDNNAGCDEPSIGRFNGEEEEEEDDDEESNGRKKKLPKVIKVRSLKSLM